MYPHPLDRASLPTLKAALAKLKPDTPRRWGKMDAHRMLAHLYVALGMTTGEVESFDQSMWLTRTRFIHWFVIDSPVPWPRSKIKVDARLTPPPAREFDAERDAVCQMLDKVVAFAEANPNSTVGNPGFGPMPIARAMRLQGRHTRHHLDQFGLL